MGAVIWDVVSESVTTIVNASESAQPAESVDD